MATELSGTSPLWAQVLDDLRARLAADEFSSRFPGDLELVAHYSVSRHTVREAVRHLQAEGLLERRRGQGSFLTSRRIEQPVGTLYSLFRSIEARGLVQHSVVRYLEERQDDKAATMLGCPPDEPLVYLERVRLADGEPIALDCSWLPRNLAEPLLAVDFHHTALYEELAQRCGLHLTSGWERIRPVLPEPRQRQLLEVSAREPAFAIERMAFRERTPVEWRHSVVRGDRFSFVSRWSSEQLDTSFEPVSQTP
ncbi:MAG: GntR family transcriptional regulator [Actinomycetota bacterium]|nr:GntR family transcriptional regulator [Actinomycetota bacterium]